MENLNAPIHRSLTLPIFWMGVPRNLLLCEVFLSILAGAIFKSFIILPLAAGVHATAVYLGKVDPHFIDVFLNGRQHEIYYYPG